MQPIVDILFPFLYNNHKTAALLRAAVFALKGDIIMTGEEIFGMIIMLGVCIGCGCTFFGMGASACKRRDPMHFWIGQAVDPKSISDIPAYNRDIGRMWKLYSLCYFAAAAFQMLSVWKTLFGTLAVAVLFAACSIGFGWLVAEYNRIVKRYKVCCIP